MMMSWDRVINDFFEGFFKRDIKKIDGATWWLIAYFGLVFPALFNYFDTTRSAIIYFMIATPAAVAFVLTNSYKIIVPKVLFLCPMDENMRREYIEKSCIVRIVFEMVLAAFGVLVLIGCGFCNVAYGIGIMLNAAVLASLVFGINNGVGEIRAIFNMVITAISEMYYVAVLSWGGEHKQVFFWIFIVAWLIIQAPLAIKDLLLWNKVIDNAADYERSYIVIKK